MSDPYAPLRAATTCRISTVGRVSGREHTVAVWFAFGDGVVYAAARHGTRSDWLRNALAGGASVLVRRATFHAEVHVTSGDEADVGLGALATKYARHVGIVRAWRADPPVIAALVLSS